MNPESSTLQPSVLSAAKKHRWLVAILAILAAAAAVSYTTFRPADSVAVVDLILEDPDLTSVLEQTASVQFDRFIGNQIQILSSRVVAEEASVVASERGVSISTNAFMRASSVDSLRGTDVISVSFRGPDPDVAQAGADALVEAYGRVRLEQSQAAVADVLKRIDDAIASVDSELDQVGVELDSSPVGNSTRAAFDQQINAVAAEVFSVDRRLAGASAEEQPELQADLARLRDRLDILRLALSTSEERADTASLLRDQTALLDRRADLEARRNQVAIDAETASLGIANILPATLAVEAEGAGRVFTALAGLILGLMAGAALAYYLALRNRTFEEATEPEIILGVPLLAAIPEFSGPSLQSGLPMRDDPRSITAEAFRFAAGNLRHRVDQLDRRTLAVVSGVVGEGKSSLVANLGAAMARGGRRVLLVDADFGNQALTGLLTDGHGNHTGLTEIVQKGVTLDQAVVSAAMGHDLRVDLLSRGQYPIIAPDLFGSQQARAIFDRLTDAYDVVIIDVPPLLQVAYASDVVRMAESAVVVVSHGSNLRRTEEMGDRLRFLGAQVVGYLYNRSPVRRQMQVAEGSLKDILGDRGADNVEIRRDLA